MDLEKILDELKGLISDIGQDVFSSKFLELARRLYHCVHTAQTNKELRNFLETQFGDQSASEIFKNLQKLSFDLRSSDGIYSCITLGRFYSFPSPFIRKIIEEPEYVESFWYYYTVVFNNLNNGTKPQLFAPALRDCAALFLFGLIHIGNRNAEIGQEINYSLSKNDISLSTICFDGALGSVMWPVVLSKQTGASESVM